MSMNNKQLRKVRTREIIRDKIISSQEELLRLLKDEGFNLTQATLSRDLKKMKISKTILADNSYRYFMPEDSKPKKLDERGFQSLEFTGNLAIIKTFAGYASPLAVIMDNHPSKIVSGTIAGRDTIFVALKESNNNREEFQVYLDAILKENRE